MKFRERFEVEHPDKYLENCCPNMFGYASTFEDIPFCNDDDCKRCWNRKMPVDDVPEPTAGLKYDDGKLRLDLIPTSAYRSIGAVLTYGAQKYAENSWQGVERERYVAALMRHMLEYRDDPTSRDEESGLKHIEHVLCNAMFLNHFEKGE